MYFLSFLCFFAAPIWMVSSNPILQPCSICPQNRPQQQSNYHLYQPINTAQSCPSPCCQNNDINRNLVNELLSNPTIQMILDPNTRLIDQDGVEVPTQPQNGNQQSIINNYIIIPPEVFTNGTNGNKKTVRNGKRRNKKNDTKTNASIAKDNLGKSTGNLNTTNAIKSLSEALLQSLPNKTAINDGNVKRNKTRNGRSRNRKRIRNQGTKNNTEAIIDNNNETVLVNNNTNLNDCLIQNYTSNYNKAIIDINNETVFVNNNTNLNDSVTQNYTSNYNNNVKRNNYQHYEQAMLAYTTSKPYKSDNVTHETSNKSETNDSSLENEFQHNVTVENNTKSNNTENGNIVNKTKNIIPKEIIVSVRNTDPKEEVIVKDLHKKYPEIPENLLQSLLSHIKEQLNNEKVTNDSHYSASKTQNTNGKSKPRRNGNNNNRRRINGAKSSKSTNKSDMSNRNSTASASNKTNNETETKNTSNINNNNFGPIIYKPCNNNPSAIENVPKNLINFLKNLMNTSKVDTVPVDKELPVNFTDQPDVIVEAPLQTSEKLIDNSNKEVRTEKAILKENIMATNSDEALNFIETSTLIPIKPKLNVDDVSAENIFPALGNEDPVPIMELNGIIDEYYPDFTKDAIAYLESNEELNINHKITDFASRHHYTNDNNYELNEYYSKKPHLNKNIDKNLNKHVQISKTNDYEDTGPRPFSKYEFGSEELEFKTPPLLDAPDFETRPINKNTYRRDEPHDYDKVSSYSDIKAAQFNYEDKPNSKISNTNTKEVETHFAKSKVVKYGQNARFSHDDLDRIFDGAEDETTLVFASPYED